MVPFSEYYVEPQASTLLPLFGRVWETQKDNYVPSYCIVIPFPVQFLKNQLFWN